MTDTDFARLTHSDSTHLDHKKKYSGGRFKRFGGLSLCCLRLLLCCFVLTGCAEKADLFFQSFTEKADGSAQEEEAQADIPTVVYNTEEHLENSAEAGELAALTEKLEKTFSESSYEQTALPEGFWEWLGSSFGMDCLKTLSAAADAQTLTVESFYEATGNSYLVLLDLFSGKTESPERALEERIYVTEARSGEETVLCFAGDVCLDDGYSNMAALRSRDNGIMDSIDGELMAELQNADVLMLNNEFPYSDRGTPTPGKQYTFRAKPGNVEILTQMGVDIVSLANNHAYDHGPEALLDTFDTLSGADIAYVGAGRNLEEATEPVYFIVNGRKFAYVSATQIERNAVPDTPEATQDSPGVLRTLHPEKFLTVIEEARRNSDYCIVYVHWGSENVETPEQSQRDLAKQYAGAGADLILGDHSHCLQGFEYVDGVPVIYSLGNFWFNSKTADTCLLKASIAKDGSLSCQMLPCIQSGSRTVLAEEGEKERILRYMEGISFGVSLDGDGNVTPAQ